jgi:TetR/AcrR family acrAB operon transcriptional repressor
VLERDGFTGLTLSAVALEADESKGSISYHFGNKEGLVVALVDSLVHEANRTLVTETHRHPMGDQRLRVLMEGERDIINDTSGFVALLEILPYAMRDDSLRKRVAALYAGYRSTVVDALVDSDDPSYEALRSLAVLTIAVVDGLSIQHGLDPGGVDMDAAIAAWRRMGRSLLHEVGMVDFA